jgi:hypothetical protein
MLSSESLLELELDFSSVRRGLGVAAAADDDDGP